MEEQLRQILQEIQDARSKNNKKAENDSYAKAQEIFGQLTGKDLGQEAKAQALQEFSSEGFGMSQKAQVFSQANLERQIEIFRNQQQTFGLQKSWNMISPEEKKSYQDDISVFVSNVEKKRNDLERAGLSVSKEIFYNMIAGGYMFPDIKKGFLSGKIKIPVLLGEGAYKYKSFSRKEFDNLVETLQMFFNLIASQAAEEKISKKFINGKRRWNQRLKRKMRELLEKEILKFESQKQEEQMTELKIENEVQRRLAERAKDYAQELEGIDQENAFKNLEKLEQATKESDKQIKKQLEKITKDLSQEIRQIGEDENKIKKIIKKQEEKNKALPKKAAYQKLIKEQEQAQ